MERTLGGLTCLIVLFSLSGDCLGVDEDRRRTKDLFAELDKNEDGQLSANEIDSERRFFFDRLVKKSDGDGDGKLNESEFTSGLRERRRTRTFENRDKRGRGRPGGQDRMRPGKLLKRFDSNGDGRLTVSEVPRRLKRRFAEWLRIGDTDGDGGLNKDELRAVLHESRQAGRGGRGRRGGLFALLDTDGDEHLTKEELDQASRLMGRLDEDGDGRLSPREVRAARSSGRASNREGRRPKRGRDKERVRQF